MCSSSRSLGKQFGFHGGSAKSFLVGVDITEPYRSYQRTKIRTSSVLLSRMKNGLFKYHPLYYLVN